MGEEIKKILAIDPGASCGFSIFKIVLNSDSSSPSAVKCILEEYGYIDIDTTSCYLGDWCIDLKRKIENLEEEKGPFDEIGVEDYFFSSRFKQGANVNPAYRTAIHMWAREKNKHYEVLNISAWKVFVCGRTTPSKEQKTKWGAVPAKKIMVVEGLKERFNIYFPEYCISKKTKRKIRFRYDIADAVAQGLYMAFLRFNCKDFSSSVVVENAGDTEDTKEKNISSSEEKINNSVLLTKKKTKKTTTASKK